jgi:hypothetical protein
MAALGSGSGSTVTAFKSSISMSVSMPGCSVLHARRKRFRSSLPPSANEPSTPTVTTSVPTAPTTKRARLASALTRSGNASGWLIRMCKTAVETGQTPQSTRLKHPYRMWVACNPQEEGSFNRKQCGGSWDGSLDAEAKTWLGGPGAVAEGMKLGRPRPLTRAGEPGPATLGM